MPRRNATENAFLGALLGAAIGDALGAPVDGLATDEARARFGALPGYLPRPDAEPGQPATGEITDKTETLLCIVESLTTNDGMLDPANINARLVFLREGPSQRWMSDATIHGIEDAAGRDGLVSEEVVSAPEASVAVRGIAVGLLHAVGAENDALLATEAGIVTRLTHGGEAAAWPTELVARATAAAARSGELPMDLASRPPASGPVERAVCRAVERVRTSRTFEEAVLAIVGDGGEASALGAIAGGVAGARFGASGIPQQLIDGLDARIYLSMAAPWFYRTVLRRSGTVLDLRVIE